MKVVFAGGGTGGHVYPLFAIIEALRDEATDQHVAELEMYFFSDHRYDQKFLSAYDVEFHKIPAGKLHKRFTITNIGNILITGWGVMLATLKLFYILPDVVMSKGAYVSIPTCIAARILGIPVCIHESDVVPGRANRLVAKWARRVAVSYPQAISAFPYPDRVAYTGQPIRSQLLLPLSDGALEFLKLEHDLPTVFVLGGSQGSRIINDVMLEVISSLLYRFQVIHQTGPSNINSVQAQAAIVLHNHPNANRYHAVGYLDQVALRMAAGAANVVVTRSGSTLFEIAAWGIPAIIVPITDSIGNHQRLDAYAYAQSGAGVVIEESNLEPHVLESEIERIVMDDSISNQMRDAAKLFNKPDAARVIAREIIAIADEHESVVSESEDQATPVLAVLAADLEESVPVEDKRASQK